MGSPKRRIRLHRVDLPSVDTAGNLRLHRVDQLSDEPTNWSKSGDPDEQRRIDASAPRAK